jgi:hypothetical protein
MDKRLLIKLAKARKDVREKLRGLTSEIASSQEMFETVSDLSPNDIKSHK